MFPTFDEELKLMKKGCRFIAGVDEAGRGPLAGPVVAAAVIISSSKYKTRNFEQAQNPDDRKPKRFNQSEFNDWDLLRDSNLGCKILFKEVKDSKKLPPRKREKLYKIITNNSIIEWGIGVVSEKIIDEINILEASLLAMKIAVDNLKNKPDFILVDGNHLLKEYPASQSAIPKGDEKIFSISAASIIAKVTRDRIILDYHKKFPVYRFDKHKGYGTKLHLEMLKKHGPCPIHRLSFSPVKRSL